MKKIFILILSVATIATLQSCSNASGQPKGASGSFSAEQDSEDLMEYRRAQAQFGEIFRSLMESFNDACDIFGEYVGEDDYYVSHSYSGLRDFFSSNESTDVY